MQVVRDRRYWRILSWWLAVLTVAVLLKHHYSVAAAADLEWMFRPLSLMLEWFSGHAFHRDGNYEWVSESADVRLVKACAGVNFMLMSFMGYAWVVRPGFRTEFAPLAWVAARILLLCTAVIAAWITCLLANSLRIMVAMTVNANAMGLDVVGIGAPQLHRLIGVAIYVPLLSLQMTLGNRGDTKDALVGPVLMYLLLMVLVPVVSGNARQHPALFAEHILYLSTMIAVMCGVFFLYSYRRRGVRLYATKPDHPVSDSPRKDRLPLRRLLPRFRFQ